MKTSLAVIGALALAGCKSDADQGTLDGVEALGECDIRKAHEAFAEAHSDDPDHPQAALGFALTDLALLPEDPIVTRTLARFGFTGPIDMQQLVFGPDGALARHARGDTCASIDEFVDATVPYPPLTDPDLDEVALIDDNLTGTDLHAALGELSPRLRAIAEALETAARGMPGPVTVEGGCGLGKITFQAPELFAGAAVLEAIRSLIQLGAAYDFAVGVRAVVEEDRAADAAMFVTLVNAHLGRVSAPGAGAQGKATFVRALGLLAEAIAAARAAGGEPDALFVWTAIPDSTLDTTERFVAALGAGFESATPIPDLTPVVTLDLASAPFATPIDFQMFSEPLFVDAGEGRWNVSAVAIDEAFGRVLSPNPFTDAVTYSWTFEDEWNALDTSSVTQPFDRYDAVYNCMVQ